MYGLLGGCSGMNGDGHPIDIKECYKSMNSHIFSKNEDIDVFVHTWSVDHERSINKVFHPKLALFEQQEQFDIGNGFLQDGFFRVKSRWVSTQRSLKLKSDYENLYKFKYDCVMVNRFDIIFLSDIIFKNYDMKKFWASKDLKYPEPGLDDKAGLFLQDMWFFSNSDAMDYLGTLGDSVLCDNGHKAAYGHIIKKYDISDSGMYPSIDYDLYRWKKGTSEDVPRKWYKHPRVR